MLGTDLVALGYTAANSATKDTLWTYTYNSPDTLEDFGATICASDSDHVYVSGQCYRAGTPLWTSLFSTRLRYGHPDLGVTAILAPEGQYDHYDAVTPQAVITNHGDVATSFNAFMYVGLPYGDTVQFTDFLEPGDSAIVEFRLWEADPVGLVPLRCSIEVTGDVNPGNDFLDDTVEVLGIDVGCQSIISPSGLADSGTTVTPVARFKNYSLSEQTFWVFFRIEAGGPTAATRPVGPVKQTLTGGPSVPNTGPLDHGTTGPRLQTYEDSASIILGGLDSMDVSFANWQATPPDTYRMEAFTALFGDDNPANDTVALQLIVRRPLHDVGVLSILAPLDTVDTGDVVVPRAVIRNFGGAQETFRIRFTIGSFFTSETAMTLAAGGSDTAEFEPWTADQVGFHTARCTTMLAGDQVHPNDVRQKQVAVLPPNGIESPENISGIPREYSLGSPQPNPFTGRMLVRYALPVQSRVSLRVYNASGTLIRALTSAELPAGFYNAVWNGTDERGRRVLPGTYFCRFQTPGFTRIAKLVMTN